MIAIDPKRKAEDIVQVIRSGMHDMDYNQSGNGIQSTSNSHFYSSITHTKSVKLKEQGIILAIILGTILIINQLTTQAYARNITAFIHIDEEAIEQNESYGQLSRQARYTVDGKNYSNWHHDMREMVYPDESYKPPNFDTWEDELMVADNASEICFEDMVQPDYRSCGYINGRAENATEIHFTYPASWIPDED